MDGFEDRIHPVRLDVTDRAATAACVEDAVVRFGRRRRPREQRRLRPVGRAGGPLRRRDRAASSTPTCSASGAWCGPPRPHLRRQGYGKIVNVSSLSGRVPSPLLSCYAATKHAIEAMSEGLAGELVAWGVQVTILEPGMYASDWQTTNLDVCERVRTGASAYSAGHRAGHRRLPGPGRHPTRVGRRRRRHRRHRAAAAAAAPALAGRRGLPAHDRRPAPRQRRRVGARMRAAGWGFRPDDLP